MGTIGCYYQHDPMSFGMCSRHGTTSQDGLIVGVRVEIHEGAHSGQA
jgi:hypothetical protein